MPNNPASPREGELKPCPHCAFTHGDPRGHLSGDGVTFWIVCRRCGALGPVEKSENAAIAAWNRRALQPAPESEATEDGDEEEGFRAIWEVIKHWDIRRASDLAYHGATGTDVMSILTTLRAAGLALGAQGWRPIESAPYGGYIDVRTVCTYRRRSGRWERLTEAGWRASDLPTAAEWRENAPLDLNNILPPPAGEEG